MGDLPSSATLPVRVEYGIVQATIDVPETRNALSADVVAALDALVDALAGRADLRALVLRGAGGTFCSGGSIAQFGKAAPAAPAPGEPDPLAQRNRGFGRLLTKLRALDQVTLAVVEGAAIGGGVGLAGVADIVLARADAVFGLAETRIGLIPAQIAPFLVQRIGYPATARMVLTGVRIDGAAAHAAGIVDILANDGGALESELECHLKGIRCCAPGATRSTKALLRRLTPAIDDTFLDSCAVDFAAALRGDEAREGVAAFLEKRQPAWATGDAR